MVQCIRPACERTVVPVHAFATISTQTATGLDLCDVLLEATVPAREQVGVELLKLLSNVPPTHHHARNTNIATRSEAR
ncbi:hypothetical protein D3C80_2010620 [compost metagenome]